MYPKSILILLLFTLSSIIALGQERETVLTAPDNWQSEIIPFPINFAPDIEYVGFEDLRFSPKWSDSTSQNFWTYTFVWYIEKDAPLTEEKLTESFNSYYDGLMKVDFHHRVDSIHQVDNTICLFIKTDEGFSGKMRVYDNFFTKKHMVLNIQVRESFCPKTNKQIIFCDISPQAFDHAVWKIFEEVTLKVACD